MTFDSSWALSLVLLPLIWAATEWRRSDRRRWLLWKAAAFALAVFAMAEPRMVVSRTRVAVAVLADSSASVHAQQAAQQRATISRMAAARGRNSLRVVAFDSSTRPGWPSSETSWSEVRGTNLEAAVRNGLTLFPPEHVARMVLISDGKENLGAVERALYQARRRGVPVDTMGLEGRREAALRVTSLAAPTRAFAGEWFTMEAFVSSPRSGEALVELTVEGKSIGRSTVDLEAGENHIQLRGRVQTDGAVLVRAKLTAGELGAVTFEQPITFVRPRALLVSGDAPDRDRHLMELFRAAGFEVERTNRDPDSDLTPYDVVIANNQNLDRWPAEQKARLEEFVQEGGGFLLIAGENTEYVESKEKGEDPVTRLLPAEVAPPRTPEGSAVVLILDKSSSMEGQKMRLARQSAIGVVEKLQPTDQVGVLVFDNSFLWVVPLAPNSDPQTVQRLIEGIVADGGTQIALALREAFQQIRTTTAAYKHILLLTDGISEEGDSLKLARAAAKLKITISTVGLGLDVNRAYLERIARTAQGQAYLLSDVSRLRQLVLRDVMEHTGSSIVEEAAKPVVVRQVEMLDGVAVEEAGPLLGWVKFVAKPGAETILKFEEENDPLLVRWQYGLGRSAVFASDATARWATNWVDWPGFDLFWSNLVRDLLPRVPAIEARTHYDATTGDLVIEYHTAGRQPSVERPVPTELYALGPDEFREVVPLERAGPADFEARIPIGERFGLFRVRPASGFDRFPEVAFYRNNNELEDSGSNPDLLRRIAQLTGGRFNPDPREVFEAGGRTVNSSIDLWPALLLAAILLNLVELAARKGWPGRFRRWA